MKYKLEHFLAFNVLKKIVWDCIKDPIITDYLVLEFTADIKTKKGKYTRKLTDLLHSPIEQQFNEYIYADMRAEGYMLITIQGGWTIITPTGDRYDMTPDNTCDCRGRTLSGIDGTCKHLKFRDNELEYRARVQLEKTKRGL